VPAHDPSQGASARDLAFGIGVVSQEHRVAIRHRTFLKGKVQFNNRQLNIDCLVRDLSDTGARISVTQAVMLPQSFDLFLPHRDQTLHCRLSWRRGDEVGVRFCQEGEVVEEDRGLPPDVARRMAELEAEVARLRRLIDLVKADPSKVSILLGNIIV
jgi:hypothetical protein